MDPFIVGCQLGSNTSWYYRHSIDAKSFFVLQIRGAHTHGKYICAWYCESMVVIYFSSTVINDSCSLAGSSHS